MKYTEILKRIEPLLNDADHSFLSYNSPVEEAVKLSIRAKNSAKPIVIVKENAYLANRLKEILLSYFDDEEIVSYLPEESLRAEEIAASYDNRAGRINALYRILRDRKLKIVLTSPYGMIRHLPKKEELLNRLIKIRKDDVLEKEELI